MRNYFIQAFFMFFLLACASSSSTTSSRSSLTKRHDGRYHLQDNSVIQWKGSAVQKAHNGTIAITKGSFLIEKSQLQSGSFELDMTSIQNLDLEQRYKVPLENHLKSPDFFDVEQYPTARFVLTTAKSLTANRYALTGNLTMKDITHPISFEATITPQDQLLITQATFNIDRVKWNVSYNSIQSPEFAVLAKDKLIDDQIEITLHLKAEKRK